MSEIANNRKIENNVSKMFINRWSPRAFSSETVEKAKLIALFEAARWAPSCYNDQPWMFVYADNEKELKPFQELLVPQNQVWANKAPVLAVIFARKRFTFNEKDNFWAEFDAGAAWMSLALQASELDLYAHGMAGFDRENACKVLGVPEEDYMAIAAIAIGYIGDKNDLPEQAAENERPNDRRPAESFIHAGRYKAK